MRDKAVALAVGLALAVQAGGARAEDVHARFHATMNSVFGAGNWRITGGYRTPERENELRAQGALTVPAGRLSRHSMGRPGAPGAYDVVVAGMSPWKAAAKLRQAGAPFRTIFAEGRHGSQGPHLHLDPYSHGGKGGPSRAAGLPWLVTDPTPDQLALALLHRAAGQGDFDAQLALAGAYAEGRHGPRNLIEAYVWTALAAANGAALPEQRAAAEQALAVLTKALTPDQVADARRFVAEPASGGAAVVQAASYVPVVVRGGAAEPIRIAGQGEARVTLSSPGMP